MPYVKFRTKYWRAVSTLGLGNFPIEHILREIRYSRLSYWSKLWVVMYFPLIFNEDWVKKGSDVTYVPV